MSRRDFTIVAINTAIIHQRQQLVRQAPGKPAVPLTLLSFKRKNLLNGSFKLRIASHNHPPSLHPSAHHVFRKRTEAEKDSIQSMTKGGAAPKQIETTLRQANPDTFVTGRDIRNERIKMRANELGGRSPIEALLDNLSTSEWIFDVKRDSENHIQYLFFAHQKQVELLLANPDVLLMDCTYRTNKYRLPLLHILGCTSLQTFFSAGFCFLRTETEVDYHWAISTFLHQTGVPHPHVFISDQEEALKSAARSLLPSVPQLLCVWHNNKNVQTRAQLVWRDADGKTKEEKEEITQKRSQFMSRWYGVVSARTDVEFSSKWQSILRDYNDQQELCDYLRNYQFKTRFEWAAAWTSQYRHYGTITTSPVEGMHKVLKDYLMTSRGDLLRVVERIKAMVENQYSKHQKNLSTAHHTIKFQHRPEKMPYLPPGIHDSITPAAIELIRQQFIAYEKDLKERRFLPCSGSFERIYGLPCRHTIQNWRNMGVQLRLDHIQEPHWYFRRPQGQSIELPSRPFQDILEPLPVQGRGRRRDDASTTRDPLAFELPVGPTPESLLQPFTDFPQFPSLTDILGESLNAPPSSPLEVPLPSLAELLQQTLTARPTTPPSTSVSLNLVDSTINAPISVTISPSSTSSRSTNITINLNGSTVNAPVSVRVSPSSSQRASPSPSEQLLQEQPQEPSSPASPLRGTLTWEEFQTDLLRHTSTHPEDPAIARDMNAFSRFVEKTGQQDDPTELIVAREAALATTGPFMDWTPRMAYNFHFGDKDAFYDESFAQARARQLSAATPAQASTTPAQTTSRPKRRAAEQAPAAWAGLSPRKRRRRQ